MPRFSRCAATVSLATSMNSSIDPVRDVALRRDDRFHQALVVEHDLRLLQVEINRSPAAPPRIENAEQLVHPLEHRQQRPVALHHLRIALGQNRIDRRVGHPLVAVNHPVVHFVAHHAAGAAIDLHQARLHQPIDVRIEAAETGRQLVRKHVHGALGEIDRGGAFVRFLVERAALRHVVRDVGDVHAEPEVAVRQPIDGNGIVEIARVLAVDGHRHPARGNPCAAGCRVP